MKGSTRVGSFAGIGVFVHWTFLLLLAWVAASQYAEEGVAGAVRATALIGVVFFCIVLHEFGHALVARRFGVPTKDITLLPIGGVARMERIPRDPMQELAIAIAGPMVNVAIAVALLVGIWLFADPTQLVLLSGGKTPFVVTMFWFNVVVVFFNMLPAFPMDGGRVLRAVLAMRLDYLRATQIAARVGQFVAIGFAIVGLTSNWMLLLIAIFVYFGAQAEAASVRMQELAKDALVRDAMVSLFTTLDADDSLEVASRLLLSGSQHDFPVIRDQKVVGLLDRPTLLHSLDNVDGSTSVSSVMTTDVPILQDGDSLQTGIETLQRSGASTIPVLRGARLVGLVTTENLAEWTTVVSSRHSQPRKVADGHIATARI